MKHTLYEYIEVINSLPVKKAYTKEELMVPGLLIDKENTIEIYYAPHNEYINPLAKIFIIGITPGFQQMSTAIAAARKGLEEGMAIPQIQHLCKQEGRFSGSLRKNIITMLDGLKLADALGVKSTSELFEDREDLMHTISLIPYSVFVKGSNYTGHTPKLLKSEFLMAYVKESFLAEYESLENKDEVLLIPLGRAVEEVLCKFEEEGRIREGRILKGFPHPSGANVNRLVQFAENKESMIEKIREVLG